LRGTADDDFDGTKKNMTHKKPRMPLPSCWSTRVSAENTIVKVKRGSNNNNKTMIKKGFTSVNIIKP
jgi:hypothetical protein